MHYASLLHHGYMGTISSLCVNTTTICVYASEDVCAFMHVYRSTPLMCV